MELLAHLVFICAALCLTPSTHAISVPLHSSLVVKTSHGAFQGATAGNLSVFLGIPFASPPVGHLRFAPPTPPPTFKGIRPATAFGAACPQQNTSFPIIPGIPSPFPASGALVPSEDCLFINVVKPANIAHGKKLPVLFWIYGGGFADGDTSGNPGNTVVERSIALNEPVIYVSANYRLTAFGFLGGKEVREARIGNVGLRDQRFALEWVRRNIGAFGGDPDKVTIWGESAGAISVGLHMFVNDGHPEKLFRGAFMQSGSPMHLADITSGQQVFDQLVSDAGCAGSKNPIACLRGVPFDQLMAAVNLSPNLFSFSSLQIAWGPTLDGTFIKRDPIVSIQKGLYAKVPFVTGDCDDEGTAFSFTTLNITNDAQFLDYISTNYLPGISAEKIVALGMAYPQDVTQGSPFDTGEANAITPQFKRLAAFQGDLIFQAPRRLFLETASRTQATYAFLFKRGKAIPLLGSFHASDIPEFYATDPTSSFIGTDALVNFVNTLDPNHSTSFPRSNAAPSLLIGIDWQRWSSNVSAPPLLTFIDPAPSVEVTADTYRAASMKLLGSITIELSKS